MFRAGAVNREFGWAAFSVDFEVQGWPFQSISSAGTGPSLPSHHTSPLSAVSAVLVKMVSLRMVCMAFGFDFMLVPGATPKYPFSGLIAQRRPSAPTRIHAMSSPTVQIFQPAKRLGGIIMAKLVLPHALGNAAAT